MQKGSTCHRTWVLDNRNSWVHLVHRHTGGLGWFDTWFSDDQRGEDRPCWWEHEHCSLVSPLVSALALFCKEQTVGVGLSEPLSYLLFQSPVFCRSGGDLSIEATHRKKWRDSKSVQVLWHCSDPGMKESLASGSRGGAPPPLPGEWLLIQASATSAQWSAQSWAHDLG